MKHLKRKIYETIEFTGEPFSPNWFFDLYIILIVILNAIAIMMESVKPIQEQFFQFLFWIEISTVILFTIEYLVRLWCITENAKFLHPIRGRLTYIFTPMAIIDFLAFFPYFATLYSTDYEFVKFFSFLRFFRFMKVLRYIRAVRIFSNVLQHIKEELFFSFLMILFTILLAATSMYYVEREIQPEVFGSIPQSLWWAVVSITTIGYGDAVPVTEMGKLLSGVIAILGIGLVAIPSGIMAAGFSEEIRRERDLHQRKEYCPYCGNHIS